MAIDAIVPAHNEAPRIVPVLRSLLSSRQFQRVIVVDDGSTDRTAEAAQATGAQVMSLKPNRGKGGAMKAALAASTAPSVAFFDADLNGLMPNHVASLCDVYRTGRFGMVCGLRDWGMMQNVVQPLLPWITGERIVRRDLLDRVPWDCWSGYSIEVAINAAVRSSGADVCLLPMTGMTIYKKSDKVGFFRGTLDHLGMYADVGKANSCLVTSGKCKC
jgi:glycosyltransferase involved in cell wall biosynthesis